MGTEFDAKNAASASCAENRCKMPLTIFADLAVLENGSIETAKKSVQQCLAVSIANNVENPFQKLDLENRGQNCVEKRIRTGKVEPTALKGMRTWAGQSTSSGGSPCFPETPTSA